MEKNEVFGENAAFTREQMQAAFALNLCTVSVSQIIAYNDLTVLDQEYETILNNLNLENMPKDEALLEIIKRLLETITFFRVQAGEKEFIEKEYQQKMKNAIWTAVPNLALLVAGANPVSMGVSLAAQVGIGYMNYRKNRSQYHLDKDQQLWKLQRAAMEQFESLQQQLFETAWRMADKYGFPDAFRLSEKQIRQYNDILMDTDDVRKYERLDAVKAHFAAYPPFWYYFGNTANAIAENEDLGLDEAARLEFKEQAKKYFAYFQMANSYNLLREDAIAASCCLEYADLLDPITEKDKILQLTDDAVRFAGSSFDVHQLCAISYLKLNESAKAAEELKLLVNENYNAVVNAQLLSSLYVERFVTEKESSSRLPYHLLSSRVNSAFLFPMPKDAGADSAALREHFITTQRKILRDMYILVLRQFLDKYRIKINRIIPLPSQDVFGNAVSDPDELYLDTPSAREERINRVKMALGNKNLEMAYRQEVSAVSYSYSIIEILNQLYASICRLDCVQDETSQLLLRQNIEASIHECRGSILEIEELLQNFDAAAYEKAQEMTLKQLTQNLFKELVGLVYESVTAKSDMQDFAITETSLMHFCRKEGINPPEFLFEHRNDAVEDRKEEVYFTPDLLSDQAVLQNDRIKRSAEMTKAIKEKIDEVVLAKDLVEFYTQEDPRMNRYFYNKALQKFTGIRSRTLAILDDRSRGDCDILFSTRGVIPIIRGHAKTPVPYSDIDWSPNAKKKELKMGVRYENQHLDMDALFALIQRLAGLAEENPEG